VRDVTDGARAEQRLDDRAAQRAGASGDDHVLSRKVRRDHVLLRNSLSRM
jgi:hypothetical protein